MNIEGKFIIIEIFNPKIIQNTDDLDFATSYRPRTIDDMDPDEYPIFRHYTKVSN